MEQFFKDLFKNLIYVLIVVCSAVFVLNLFNIKFAIVESNSMQPTLNKGDLVLINPYKKIGVGDMVAFDVDGLGIVTHRLLKISEFDGRIYYLCAGDNNPFMATIHNAQINLKNYKDRIDYLNSVDFDYAAMICENVVSANQIVGVVSLKFNRLGNFIYKYLWIIFVVILILYLKNNQKMFKKYQKYIKF